jgi:ATP-dependent DNA helicase RecG
VKAPRVIIYEGTGKIKTGLEQTVITGYAVGFDGLVNFVHDLAPQNRCHRGGS